MLPGEPIALSRVRNADRRQCRLPGLGAKALGFEIDLLHLDRLLQRQTLAGCRRGKRIAATVEPRQPVGILGGDGGDEGRAPPVDDRGRGSHHLPPLGAVPCGHDLPLGGLDAAHRRLRVPDLVPFGLPGFEGSLARPFQGSRYRSRS